MTFWLEIGGQFWMIPQYRKHGYVRRVFWLLFGVGWMPVDFGSFLNGFGKAVQLSEIKEH